MIPREVMQAIRRIEIRTRRKVSRGIGGEYHSVFKGRGMEFAEVREYQPGDDVRTIDWNVTSRTGHLHVKRFVEERELTVMLLVDASRSGDFGSSRRSKLETAAEVAAVLAFSAERNNDRVGLLLFTDRVELHVPPGRGGQHVLRVVRDVLCHEPQGAGTDVALALRAVSASLAKRAVVFLISDFLSPDFDLPLRIAARKHDVVAVRVSDPREADVPDLGLVELTDAESLARRVVDTSSRRVRERMAHERRRRDEAAGETLRRARVDVLEVRTDQPYDLPLLRFFRARERRARLA